MTRASNGRHPFWLLVMGLGVCRTAAEQSTDSTLPTSAPPFKQLRYDENYLRYVGHQAEAMLEWRLDRHFTFTADYAHFFAGDFLKQTTPGKGSEELAREIAIVFHSPCGKGRGNGTYTSSSSGVARMARSPRRISSACWVRCSAMTRRCLAPRSLRLLSAMR